MDGERVTVVLEIPKRGERRDVEIPLYITANELIPALDQTYGLGLDSCDDRRACLQAENPIALLRGGRTLAEYGIRKGSVIYFTEGGSAET